MSVPYVTGNGKAKRLGSISQMNGPPTVFPDIIEHRSFRNIGTAR